MSYSLQEEKKKHCSFSCSLSSNCVSKSSEWRKYTSKVPVLLFIYTLSPLSSLPLVYAFANVLMRCVVTMASNVSDSSDAWPGVLLHAHMLQHSLMPHRADHKHKCTCNHAYMQTHIKKVCPFKEAVHAYRVSLYTNSMRARVQSGVCQCKTAAASCMRRETSCCLASNRGRSAKISTNQICWGWMQEVSLTASRRKKSETLWGNTISSSEDKRGAGKELSYSYLSFCLCNPCSLSFSLQLLLS